MDFITRDKVLISVFVALKIVGKFIKIPISYVPLIIQFFFCSISGINLEVKKGALFQIIYLVIGLIGISIIYKWGRPIIYYSQPSII